VTGRAFKRDESGLTLIEILMAVAVIMIGLVAILQWFPMGTAGVETGKRQSTAVFLAEQRLEQIKSWAVSGAAGANFANFPVCGTPPNPPCNVPGTPLVDDAFNSIPGYGEYSRSVIVEDGPTPTMRMVRVQVSYRRVTTTGALTGGTQVDIGTLLAAR
jgi:type II secretory pathway pseudopilin PulG